MLSDRTDDATSRQATESSAQSIVSLVLDLIQPRSVLDVGCGDGTWLDTYRWAGVEDYLGVDDRDGREGLRIPADRFTKRDFTVPLDLGRRFDLVQSLQVAERLPPAAAEEFVHSLTRHGDAILFAAAIPHQGGSESLNEQWPDYWAALFRRVGFAVYDWVRPRVWGNEQVAWWYAQNILLFVREGYTTEWVRRLPRSVPRDSLLRLVHPQQYQLAVERGGTSPKPAPSPSGQAVHPRPATAGSFDVAVVIPTVGRPTLERAVRSVFAQEFPGTIQILIGIDIWSGSGNRKSLETLVADAPSNRTVTILDLGYSTSVRHGGPHAARDGGALRTILSYAAHSRLVAYLDDDNWWTPDHLSALTMAIAGRAWAYSLRWYVDPATNHPLSIDRWESVGPDAGCFRTRFGGWVDPNCLLIDKVVCEPTLRLWCHPLVGDATGMSADRSVFADLRQRGPAGSTGRATVYYTLNPADGLHANRLRWVTQAQSPRSAPISAKGGFTADWFSHNVPVWEKVLAPLAGRPLNALEVGVFEGRSAVWLLEWVLTHPDSSLTWVDTFGGSAEHAGRDLSGLEGRFRANVARFGAKVTGHVGRSQDILRTMQGERFDLVYLDGSHAAADVLADAVLAWPLLKPGGLLGFDDYKWRDFPEPEKCPGVAIDGFLASMRGRYREIHHGYQVWVQKLG